MSQSNEYNELSDIALGSAIAKLHIWQDKLLQGLIKAVLFVAPIVVVIAVIDAIEIESYWTIPFYIGAYLLVVIFYFLKQTPYKIKAWSIVGVIFLLGITDFIQDGYQSSARVLMLTVPFLTGILIGRKQSYISLLIVFITFLGFGALYSTGVLFLEGNPEVADFSSWSVGAVTMTLMGLMIVVSLGFMMDHMTAALDQSMTLTRTLEEERGALEERISLRTRALQTSAEVSQRLSTIMNEEELVSSVVEEIKSAFDYYHVQIYLVDESGFLHMVGGTGEAGRKMLEHGHKIIIGQGLVGRSAAENEVVLVADTNSDPSWLPNPLLPNTKAEIVVPISIGKTVLGVLDIQQNVEDGLGAEDCTILNSIANQVAVAIQNSKLYTATQMRAERETLLNQFSQRIQLSESVDELLRITAKELSLALGADKTKIQIGGLLDEETIDVKPELFA